MSSAIMRQFLSDLSQYFMEQRRVSLDQGTVSVSQRVLQL